MPRRAEILRLPMAAPDDVSAIAASLRDGRLDPGDVVAVFAKTEGNGCVNDFTRPLAVQALRGLFGPLIGEAALGRIAMVMSGGTEGGLSPHWLVIAAREAAGPGPALAVGQARTPPLAAEDLGRRAQVEMVAAGVRAAMREAGLDAGQVHYVQVKCPLLTSERIGAALARGAAPATRDTLKSMGLSRAAAALGAALALGEVPAAAIGETVAETDPGRHARRCGASAGVELLDHEVVVMGMSPDWTGPLVIDHAVMADAIDLRPVAACLGRLGLLGPDGFVDEAGRARLAALLAKAEASADGAIRGRRHTMLTDSDIAPTRHARGFVAGALAGLVGATDLFVSGGAEFQGPDGGGPVAVIARRSGAAGPA
ncbi:ring-opening amidohydrolase [Methylobacterium sp. 4-46]|uniref:Cyanuric acid amidohydrolase n=1 Tax=Methylobacterium sp. (strain 4-46) TaxID=426117 RepID=CAH_METS4|nr:MULTISPECIES: ring-opening amidohydrolase [Methylobacterium]B0UET5.1 RecName: Full=Cyanuric acid amidohydrolase; Short=CAH [Methylobacterium sp. 4-46]ACA18193.1 ring-opening amidohydrolase [Methylobacterium sp. 4-46]WFT77488.1 ring-opening amidohydrolase [Methylobacterium nodulans]